MIGMLGSWNGSIVILQLVMGRSCGEQVNINNWAILLKREYLRQARQSLNKIPIHGP
jgi:hypothetical protein